eukprot:2917521-Alexandrium_andersonii.AAC.1
MAEIVSCQPAAKPNNARDAEDSGGWTSSRQAPCPKGGKRGRAAERQDDEGKEAGSEQRHTGREGRA